MPTGSKNLYFHADGDSFFVGCELSLRPELKGLPVIVGADRGIAVAMSREAKAIGVTRGMPVFQIKKLFPEVVILPHNFELYEKISQSMYQILLSYFSKVEVYSIDECFALVESPEVGYFGGEKKLLLELQREIVSTLNVSYSFGLGRTKALAKLASKLNKPGGLVMLLSKEDEARALKQTPIDDIWGIGRMTVPKLRKLGLRTAYDFVNYPEGGLEKHFSEPLRVLQKELRGEPILKVDSDPDPRGKKSIQATATFRPASTDLKVIMREIAENAEYACREAREIHLLSNKVSFFLKTSEFKYYFGEVKLPEYTADPGAVLNAVEHGVAGLLPKGKRIRSTGVILHNLVREERAPRDLFGTQERAIKKLGVEEAADQIREKYGRDIIKRAASLPSGKKPESKNRGTSF